MAVALAIATFSSDKDADSRNRDVLRATLKAHAMVMARALPADEEETKTLDRLAAGDLAEAHGALGARLNGNFAFEFTYLVAADGTLVYSSEFGRAGEQRNFAWLRPAVARLLATMNGGGRGAPAADGDGIVFGVAASDAGGGWVAARMLRPRPGRADREQPLLAVVVDNLDPDFLHALGAHAQIEDLHLDRRAAEEARIGALTLVNLVDGTPVSFSWRAALPGRGLLAGLAPLIVLFSVLACAIFYVLMRRAQRLAAALRVSEARARELAAHDELTGLANRSRFIVALDHALSAPAVQGPLVVFFIDLDGFKEINDTSGHGAGDELLRAVGRRLRGCVGGNGLAARFGGDEFVLFLRCASEEELTSFIATVFGVIDIPIELPGEAVRVSASIGAARAPEHGSDAAELMRLADIALYRAKSEGRGTYRMFEARFEREQLNRRRVEEELATAIDTGALKVLYQPQVDVESERVVGFEALVRWDHPTRGRILPGEFVPIAEASRLIGRLDAFVLRTACAEARALPGVTLSVNMSPLNLRHAGVVDNVLATLRETGFDPNRLEIEITESAFIDANAEVQTALDRLRGHGVRLALDDFGTGHASLVHVRRYPITKIKIDKSFIMNLGVQRDAASIVEYVVRLGRSLGITLTAEGVETREQLRFLRAFGAHQAQGYLFAPPLPLAAAVAMLERQRGAERSQRRSAQGTGAPREPG